MSSKYKQDIKSWKRFFFDLFRFSKPNIQIPLSNNSVTIKTVNSDIKGTADLQIVIATEHSGDVQMTLSTRDAHRLGTALLGFYEAWYERNSYIQDGYHTREMERLGIIEKEEKGVDKKKKTT